MGQMIANDRFLGELSEIIFAIAWDLGRVLK